MKEITIWAYKGCLELHLAQVATQREPSWFFDDGDIDDNSKFYLVAAHSFEEVTIDTVIDIYDVEENSILVKSKRVTNGVDLIDALHLSECLDADLSDRNLNHHSSIIEAYFGGWRIIDIESDDEIIIESKLSVGDDFDDDSDDFTYAQGGDELWDSMDDEITQIALKKFRLEREAFPDHIKEKYGLPITK